MPTVQVPEPYVPPLEALGELPDEKFDSLAEALAGLPAFGPRRSVDETIETTLGEEIHPSVLAYAITSLLRQFPDRPAPELAGEHGERPEPETGWSPFPPPTGATGPAP